jgi:hypothetical protein
MKRSSRTFLRNDTPLTEKIGDFPHRLDWQRDEWTGPSTTAACAVPPPKVGREEDPDLQEEAQAALRSSHYRPLWHLHCQVQAGVAVLSGIVSSYYLKQMAQTVLLSLKRLNGVENRLVVQAPQP